MRLAGRQLIGWDPATNDLLQRIIGAAIAPADRAGLLDVVVIRDAGGNDRLKIKAVRFPQEAVAGTQLLRGILIVTECSL